MDLEFRVQGLGFKVQGLWCRKSQALWFRNDSSPSVLSLLKLYECQDSVFLLSLLYKDCASIAYKWQAAMQSHFGQHH